MGIGSREKLREIQIHDIYSDLGPFRYLTLPMYAIKWCEITSHLIGCGKTIACASWQNTPGLTGTLLALINGPSCLSLSTCRSWNDFWFSCVVTDFFWLRSLKPDIVFYTSGKKTLENNPHSQAALCEHVKRALRECKESSASYQLLLEASNLRSSINP